MDHKFLTEVNEKPVHSYLKTLLEQNSRVLVHFKRLDNAERFMEATLRKDIIPATAIRAVLPPNRERVWDMGKKEWRTIPTDRVISINIVAA